MSYGFLKFNSNYMITDGKLLECITVVNDDYDQKPARCHEYEKPATSFQVLEVEDASDS